MGDGLTAVADNPWLAPSPGIHSVGVHPTGGYTLESGNMLLGDTIVGILFHGAVCISLEEMIVALLL